MKDPGTGEVSDFSWQRGNLLTEKAFDESSRLVSTQSIEYNVEPNLGLIRWSRTIYWGWNCSCGFCFWGSNTGNHDFLYKNISLSRPVTVKKQTKEIYDLIDPSKKMVSITEYQYDPFTYLPTQTIRYDLNRPSEKYISQVKYPTDPDYDYCTKQYEACVAYCDANFDPITNESCWTDCYNQKYNCEFNGWSPGGEAGAIVKLKIRNQISTPIETISLLQKGATIKVLSSNVNTFSIEGASANHIHLKETWASNTFVDQSAWTKSKILSNGSFEKDARLRKQMTNNVYDQSSGNLFQQTSFNGIQTNYTWGYSNSLVTSTTLSGGINTRTSSSTHKPMVGTLTTTDANGRTTTQEYDVYNRPSISKDHDGNIISRTRYHYANETPGFVLSISPNRTEALTNETLTFSATDIAASSGGVPQFNWDMGNGTVFNNTSTVTYSYPVPGNYIIKLIGSNAEYGSTTRAVQLTISNPLAATICEDGPVWIDLCGNQLPSYGACTANQDPYSPTLITATPNGGCASAFTYYWDYRNSNNTYWYSLNSNLNSITFYPPSVEGNYEVRCSITDGCGNSIQVSSNLSAYKSDPNCSTVGIR